MNTVGIDETGDLKFGYFYELEIPLREASIVHRRRGTELITSDFSPADDVVYGEVSAKRKPVFECKTDRSHETGDIVIGERTMDLYGGTRVHQFVYEMCGLHVVVSRDFSERVAATKLGGVVLKSVEIGANQSRLSKPPKLNCLEFMGRDCRRKSTAKLTDGNKCPFCSFSPIFCLECSYLSYECPACKKSVVASQRNHEGKGDKRWLKMPVPRLGQILNGSEWDGADFIGGFNQGFISRRALQWFQSVHAGPFVAVPCRVDFSDISAKQHELLNQIRELKVEDLSKDGE